MKIKIKSREEIEKTLEKGEGFDPFADVGQYKGSRLTFAKEMIGFCGEEGNVEGFSSLDKTRVWVFDWYWHKDWYEVIEPDFTEEDLMDIELMDEMLRYFLEDRWKRQP